MASAWYASAYYVGQLAWCRNRGTFYRWSTGVEPQIRRASESDTEEIECIVTAADRHYVSRIGKHPAPMADDYRELVCPGKVWVLTLGVEITGLVVLKRESDYMLLGNVAVIARDGRQRPDAPVNLPVGGFRFEVVENVLNQRIQ
jgi:hypothetical protein